MKRTVYLLLSVILLIGLLAACAEEQPADGQPQTEAATHGGLENDSIFDPDQPEATESTKVDPTDPTQEQDGTKPTTGDPTEPTKNDPTEPTKNDPTEPTKDDPTEPTKDDSTEPTKNDPTEPTKDDPTKPTETPTEPVDTTTDYETFMAMTPARKREFQESFPTLDDFFRWYNAARDAYYAENAPTEIGKDGTVELD